MLTSRYLLIIISLFPFLLTAQEFRGFVIKTLPFQDVFYQNPNLILEKQINKKYSFEIAASLRNGAWVGNGTEGLPVPTVETCNGFTFGVAVRHYYNSTNISPNGWFTSTLLRYNSTNIKNLVMYDGRHSTSRIVGLKRSGPEIGIIAGHQFLALKHITIELYMGAGTYLQSYRETFISGNENEMIPDKLKFTFRPYFGWSVGYYIKRNKSQSGSN